MASFLNGSGQWLISGILLFAGCLAGCRPASTTGPVAAKDRLTEEQVLPIVGRALAARFPERFERYRPYHVTFEAGEWIAFGSLPHASLLYGPVKSGDVLDVAMVWIARDGLFACDTLGLGRP